MKILLLSVCLLFLFSFSSQNRVNHSVVKNVDSCLAQYHRDYNALIANGYGRHTAYTIAHLDYEECMAGKSNDKKKSAQFVSN